MKKIILLSVCFMFSVHVHSQHFDNFGRSFFAKDSLFHRLEFNHIHNHTYYAHKDRITFERSYFLVWGNELQIGYFPIKKTGFGISTYYSFVISDVIDLPPSYSVGIWIKQYIPYKINRPFLRRFDFFVSAHYKRTNYRFNDNKPLITTPNFSVSSPFYYDSLSQDLLNVSAGYHFLIWNKLYFRAAIEHVVQAEGFSHTGIGGGFSYYFFNQ